MVKHPWTLEIWRISEGCACPMGVLSREFLKKLRLNENWIAFIDMEAGIEHFGRGIDEAIDKVILVVEPSFESLNVAEKIRDLAAGMNKAVYKWESETSQSMLRSLWRFSAVEGIGAFHAREGEKNKGG
jgi:CO dehydrogenase nickel-insertion accessory protein CooC1